MRRIERLAEALAKARVGGTLAEPVRPTGLREAEAIRDLAAARTGSPVVGYKIGATSVEAQRIIGCDGPFYGPMIEAGVVADGGSFAVTPGALGAECEFAFRMGRDLPARDTPYEADEVADAVGACHAAIELIARRTAGQGFPGYLPAVADFALNAGFLAGAEVADWRARDLAAMPVEGLVDGVQVKTGSGAAVLGHPLNALTWLANRLSADGLGLKAGEWVSTGTCLGVVPTAPGTLVEGVFGGTHRVSVRLS